MDFDTWLVDEKGYDEYDVRNNKHSLFGAAELDYLYDEWKNPRSLVEEKATMESSDKYHYISATNRNLTPICGYPADRLSKEEAIAKFVDKYGSDIDYTYSTTMSYFDRL